jgi:hypothetical protein
VELGEAPCRLAAGAHICYLYHDDDERRELLTEFVRQGTERNEVVLYIADSYDDEAQIRLRWLGVLPADGSDPAVVVTDAVDMCCPSSAFAPEPLLARLRVLHEEANSGTRRGIRIAAEMTWALREIIGSEQLVPYESAVNELLATHPMTLLCQYDMRRFDGATGFSMLGVHPLVIVNGKVVPNPY